MSRCLFVFALFNLQGTELAGRFAVSLLTLPHLLPFVKNFFQVFSNFFFVVFVRLCSRKSLAYISRSTYICQALFSTFLKNFSHEKIPRLSRGIWGINRYHSAGRSRRHFSYRPLRSSRRYPHRGMQRSYDPAGSSAELPLLWSWA